MWCDAGGLEGACSLWKAWGRAAECGAVGKVVVSCVMRLYLTLWVALKPATGKKSSSYRGSPGCRTRRALR